MAEFARSKDPYTANIMLREIERLDYLHAASYWFLTKEIVLGDKCQFLSDTLSANDIPELADGGVSGGAVGDS